MFPIRCFTCNNVIAQHWEFYIRETSSDKTRSETLEGLGIHRICCRRMFLSHVPTIDDILHYGNDNEVLDEAQTRFLCRPSSAKKVSCD